METIERVARAICNSRGMDPDDIWDCRLLWWEVYIDDAKAAIAAMQEDIQSADKIAREECAEIADSWRIGTPGGDYIANKIREHILETIK